MEIHYKSSGEIIHIVREVDVYWDCFGRESRGQKSSKSVAESGGNQADLWDLEDNFGKVDSNGLGKWYMDPPGFTLTERVGWEEHIVDLDL